LKQLRGGGGGKKVKKEKKSEQKKRISVLSDRILPKGERFLGRSLHRTLEEEGKLGEC